LKSLAKKTGFLQTVVFWHSLGRETRFLLLQGILETGFRETGVFWRSFGQEIRFLSIEKLQSQESRKYTD
jgi:hypothetical protein